MAAGPKRGAAKDTGGAGAKPTPQAEGPGHSENPNMPTTPGDPEDPRRPGNPDYPDQPREGPRYRRHSRNPYQT